MSRLPRFWLFIATLLSTILLFAMFVLPGEPAQAQPTLNFLNNPLKLTLASKQDPTKECNPQTGVFEPAEPGEPTPDLKTTKATVWVRYTEGEEPLQNLRFNARAKANTSGDVSTPPWKDLTVCWEPADGGERATLQPLAVRPFEVSIEVGSPPRRNLPERDWLWNLTGPELTEYWEWFQNPSPPYEWSSLSGYLIVRATAPDQEAEPGTLSLQLISPAQGYKVWFLRVLTWFAVWVGVVFAFLSVWLFIREFWRRNLHGKFEFDAKEGWASLKKSLGGELDFDIKGGWASTLTTVGAVLGTFLSAGIVAEDTFFMAKGQYTALNVIFGLIVLLAYLLFRFSPRSYTLLLAGVLILGAAAGELATVWLLLYELAFQGVLSASDVPLLGISIVSLMQIILLCTAVAVTRVAGRKLLDTIKKGKPAADDKAVVRSFYKAWKDNAPAELDKILAPYYVYHHPGEEQDVEAIRQKMTESRNEFPFIHFAFEDQSAGEGKVGSRITMQAERPPADGGVAAAGERISLEFIDICRIAGGRIEEQWIRPIPESWSDV